jgi:peptidoglycan/xylan/chitin deacetylase (PgdA/CDA1 family)
MLLATILVAVATLASGPGPAQTRLVALTFDDLPAAGTRNPDEDQSLSTPDIRAINEAMVSTLKRHHAPAVGFVNERGISEAPDVEERRAILRIWVRAGLDLGNHTYSHADLNQLSIEAFEREIEKGETSIGPLMREAGKPLAFFRFPYNHTGDTKDKHTAIQNYLRKRGYAVAACTIDSEDFKFERAYGVMLAKHDVQSERKLKAAYLEYTSAEIDYYAVLHRQVFGREIPQVMLLHANRLNAAVLEDVLTMFEKKGYQFVSLAEAQTDQAFATPETYVSKWGPMWGYRWASVRGVKVDGSKEAEPPAWVTQYGR